MEIGPGDLALTREEASPLLREAGVALSEDDVAELHRSRGISSGGSSRPASTSREPPGM